MFPRERFGTMKCDYCGFVASSAHELLTRHTCYRTLHARNVVQRPLRIYRPSVIKRTETQALRSTRLSSVRQSNLKNSISKDIRNNSRGKKKIMMNSSKVHYGFRPSVISSYSSQSIPSSPWGEILDESEIPVPVLEYGRENQLNNEILDESEIPVPVLEYGRGNKLNNEILDESEVPVPVLKYIRKNEFLNERNNSLRNNENFIPSPVTVYRRFPSNSFLERASSSKPLRISPVNSNHASSTQLTSSFYDTEPLSVNTVHGSESVSESSSNPMHVILVSPINKETTIVSLNNVMNEIVKKMERLPCEIKLQLEHEFLQKVQDSVDEERRRVINAV